MRLARDLLDFEYRLVGHPIGHLIMTHKSILVRNGAHCRLSGHLMATTRHASELFRVKKPLVDLHARKASLFHSFELDLGAPVAVEPLE